VTSLAGQHDKPPSPTHVLDPAGVARLFQVLAGRRLLGALDCGDCCELVFESDGCNLVTIYGSAGRFTGQVLLGAVLGPEEYVRGVNWPL
jgi:hypothetical protein